MGAYSPKSGQRDDWALLGPADIADNPFQGMAKASLATPQEMEALTAAPSDALNDRRVEVWHMGYPMPSFRSPPRKPIVGGPFFAQGFLKSHRAYQTFLALAAEHHVIYDDRIPDAAYPTVSDVHRYWRGDREVADHFDRYREAGDPLLFHSADYANGSSGGGVFATSSGKLIGIIVFGASLVSRRDAYAGFGQLFRVDRICATSSHLECE